MIGLEMGLNAQQYPDSKIYYFVSYEGTFETVATDLNVLSLKSKSSNVDSVGDACFALRATLATIRRRVSLPKGSYNSGKR